MIESARALALLSAVLMVTSLAVFSKWLRGPLMQRLDGQRASNIAPSAIVLKLLIAALVISAVAAVLAVVGWINA